MEEGLQKAAQAIGRTGVEAGIHTEANSSEVASSATASSLKEDMEPLSKHVASAMNETAVATNIAAIAGTAKIQQLEKEEKIRNLILHLIECQVKKMELKVQQFDALEHSMKAEREQLIQERYRLYLDTLTRASSALNDPSQNRR